ncbi:SEC10/PgrA surface exclusion domain-containing protein [Lactobacillus sp.]|uniref:SEC10/PgrA surface exclusion domain-containing protein n=1 Tax=Lactobacillus sp. TaxID=1591 RepID=UPI0019B9B4AD|nr:SEC10/PgrA surface exclusion domain-containing protein [Lactobacillus sp.]MBD5429229.1 SEC10/PgrA surface exclusion domain-containing protein [Lactobacillus sp.]
MRQAQDNYNSAKSALDSAHAELKQAQDKYSSTKSAVDSYTTDSYSTNVAKAQDTLDKAQTTKTEADNNVSQANKDLEDKQKNQTDAIDNYNKAVSDYNNAQANLAQAQVALKAGQDTVADNQAKLTKAQTDLANLNNENADLTQELSDAKQTVNDKTLAVSSSQTDLDNANAQLADANEAKTNTQHAIEQAQTDLTNAQNSLSDLQTKYDNAKTAFDKAKEPYEQAASMGANDIKLDQDYLDMVKKYTDAYTAYWNDTTNTVSNPENDPQFMNDARKVSDENWVENRYVHNNYDKSRTVDVMNLTDAERLELNIFTVNLLNSVRSQLGSPLLTLNKSAMNLAHDISDGYTADNRSCLDGKHHDTKVINTVANNYGLMYDDDYSDNYYEDMSSFWTTGYSKEDSVNQADDTVTTLTNTAMTMSPIDTTMNMDHLKYEIYKSLIGMIFADDEWDHMQDLTGTIKNDPKLVDSKDTVYYYGFSLSMLNNPPVGNTRNGVSDHFEIIKSDDIQDPTKFDTSANVDHKTLMQYQADLNDLASGDLSTLQDAYTAAESTLTSAKSAVDDANTKISNAQDALKSATARLASAQNAADVAQNAVKLAQVRHDEATNAATAAQNKVDTLQAQYDSYHE